jgi:hypothetical protein
LLARWLVWLNDVDLWRVLLFPPPESRTEGGRRQEREG